MIVNGKYKTLRHNRANAFNVIKRSLKLPATVAVSVRQVKKEASTLGKFENAALCVGWSSTASSGGSPTAKQEPHAEHGQRCDGVPICRSRRAGRA